MYNIKHYITMTSKVVPMMHNPFFTGIKGGSISGTQLNEIYNNYNHAYIMCIKNDIKMDDNIRNTLIHVYDKQIQKSNLINICVSLI